MTRTIDAAGRIVEPGPEEFACYMPRGGQGQALFPEACHLQGFSLGQRAAIAQRPTTATDWTAFMDGVGIERVVLYSTVGAAAGRVLDEYWATAACRAWNDWASEAFINVSPRLKCMALVPIQDPQAAAEELRRAVTQLGMLGAVLPSTGEGFKGHYGSRIYWPLYEEAMSLGCALAIRGGSHVGLGMDALGTEYPVEALGHQFGVMIQAFALMSSGVFDQFPGLRWGFLEGGAGWVPLFLDRIDRKFEASSIPRNAEGEWFAGPRPDEKASDYFKGHIRAGRVFVGFDLGEAGLGYAVERAGHDPYLFASNFPRRDAAVVRREIDDLLARDDLREQAKEDLLAGNAERFYGQPLMG